MRTSLVLVLLLCLSIPSFGQNKKQKKEYAAYIVSGDSAFNLKNYTFAKNKYKLASTIKPNESYPTTRMSLCDKMALEQGVEYKRLILKADSCFEKKDWANAKTYYVQATVVKPTEQYAEDQAKNCNYQIVAKQAMENLYSENLRRGDSCFNMKSWSCAKANYEAASRVKPEEKYPKDRIAECEKKITPAVNKERYEITISDADNQFNAGNYVRAKELYQEALTFNPGAKYATDKIAQCEEKINAPK